MKKRNEHLIVFINSVTTGFFGGFLLSLFHLVIHFFNISKINHEMILNYFFISGKWIGKWYGYIFFVLFISVLSIIFALIYYVLFRKINGWFIGVVYGLMLWTIFGLFIPLLFYDISFTELVTSRTNVATICSFILYGVFIGYSISYDYEITVQDKNVETTD